MAVIFASPGWAAEGESRPPNIVLILVDDLGYGDVQSNYPAGKIATPQIDQLAKEGMRFTDAHSGAAVCSPTRYGVLTGQHFSRQPWARITYQFAVSMIDQDRLTLGEMLQSKGYHTGAFGKWHLGMSFFDKNSEIVGPGKKTDWSKPTQGGPNDHGFDRFFGVPYTHAHGLQAMLSDRFVTTVPTELASKNVPKAVDFAPVNAMPETTAEALKYIDWNTKERPDQPFFLYFATVAIHDPVVPSAEFVGKSSVGLYGDFVMQTDAAVGKVMAKLAEHDLVNDTLVIFTSDNGSIGRAGDGGFRQFPMGGVAKAYKHNMNGDWRGLKGMLWEGGHRVPFIARWPGTIEPGSVSNELIVLEDLMATSAAIVGVELPPGSAEDSYNILPYFDGSHEGPPIRDYAVLSTMNGDAIVRKNQWVLSFFLGSGGQFTKNRKPGPDDPKGQLYDLERDPGQEKNIWLENPEVVKELTSFYEAHVERGSSFGIDR